MAEGREGLVPEIPLFQDHDDLDQLLGGKTPTLTQMAQTIHVYYSTVLYIPDIPYNIVFIVCLRIHGRASKRGKTALQ